MDRLHKDFYFLFPVRDRDCKIGDAGKLKGALILEITWNFFKKTFSGQGLENILKVTWAR